MKYDTSLIKEEVRRQRAQQRRDDLWRTIQALYPLGCLLIRGALFNRVRVLPFYVDYLPKPLRHLLTF